MRPNILFVMADQFRADALGCVGGWARTPHLDSLAARGCRFTNAFANSAECVPSRISLATGLYPHQFGIDKNASCTLNPSFPNWMQSIEATGYRTSLFGKTHLHPHVGDIRDRLDLVHRYGLRVVDETTGPRAAAQVRSNMTDAWARAGVWEQYREDVRSRFAVKPHEVRPGPLPLDLYYDRYVGNAAAAYLQDLDEGDPWFCWVSFGGPHEPWDAPEPYASMYRPEDMPLPLPRSAQPGNGLLGRAYRSSTTSPPLTAQEVAEMRANYAGNVTLIDDEIGLLLEILDRRGWRHSTVIVFTSDHGELNGDFGLIYKANFLDAAIKVPLVISSSSGAAPRVVNGIVELMDVGATLVGYAMGNLPEPSLARSLRDVVEEGFPSPRLCALSEFAGHTCVVSDHLKVEFDVRGEPVRAIDRIADPGEQCNVLEAGQPPSVDAEREALRCVLTTAVSRPDALLPS